MEGIFIPNASRGDNRDEAEMEEEGSRLVTTVEEIASAMLRLALEFGEKGFLEREFILYLRSLIREITGEGQQEIPQPTGATAIPSVQPRIENFCQCQPPPEYIASIQCPACIQAMLDRQ